MNNCVYEKKMELGSHKSSMAEVEPLLKDLQQAVDIPDEKFYNLLIAVTEAVNNAIVHGNKYRKDKRVLLIIESDKSSVVITVIDEGEGFNPNNVADPRHPENLMKDSGRGVFIMKSLADEIIYESGKNGTELKIIFYYK
ncbi:MAG: ATP-binding protein [Candidatus Kapaibacterium sp.]